MDSEVAILIKAIDRATSVIKGISKVSTTAFLGIAGAATAGVAAFTALGMGYVSLIRKGIEYNANMEQYRSTLETVLKSQEKALAQLEWARTFAAETPFAIPEIIQATVRLTTYNLKAQEVLRTIGDMAAVMGKPLMQAIEAVADAQTGELERLKEFGITKTMLIAKGMAVSARGQIEDFKTANDALFQIMEERYAGGMKKMMTGFQGMTSNIKDWWGVMIGELGKPAFEQIKKDLRSLLNWTNKVQEQGRLQETIRTWAEAGGLLVKTFSTMIKEVFPSLLDHFQKLSKRAQEFLEELKPEDVAKFLKKLYLFAEGMAKLGIKVSLAIVHHWKLVAAIGALAITSKIALGILALSRTIAVVVAATKVWAAANVGLMASLGPIAIALAVGGAIIVGLALYAKHMGNAKKETEKFRKELVQLKLEKIIKEFKSVAERQIELIKLTIHHNKLFKRHTNYLTKIAQDYREGKISQKEYSETKRQLIMLMAKELELEKAYGKEAKKLGKIYKEKVPLPKLPKEPSPVETPKEILELRKELKEEIEQLTISQYEKELKEAEKYYTKLKKRAKGDTIALGLIAEMRGRKEAEINDRILQDRFKMEAKRLENIQRIETEAKALQQIQMETRRAANIEILQAQGKTHQVEIAQLNIRAQEIARVTKDQLFAEQWLTTKLQEMGIKSTEIRKNLQKELEMKILESQEKMKEMALISLEGEIEGYRKAGLEEERIAIYKGARIVQIDKEFIEKKKNRGIQMAQEFQSQIKALDEEYYQFLNSSRDESFYREQARIQNMGNIYNQYVSLVMSLGAELFGEQKTNWLKVIAMVISFGSRIVATYLRNQALEKLKQASEAKTQSKWLQAHASRLVALAAEATMLAAIRLGMGDILGAAKLTAAAIAGGAKAAQSLAEAATFEIQAKRLQTEAAGLMATSVAVEMAGKVAAKAFETMGAKQERAAYQAEVATKRRGDLEKKLQEDIFKYQMGREAFEVSQIEKRIRDYREMGVEAGILEQWRKTQMGEIAGIQPTPRGEAADVLQMPVSQWDIPMLRTTETGAKEINIEQNVYIDGFINTADEAHLRKFASTLQPYLEEVEERAQE